MLRTRLLLPFWFTIKNRFSPARGRVVKPPAMALFSLLLCAALYRVSCSVVGYFHGQNELGIILSLKIFQMSWIILFGMLVFSCMVSAVSALFLSQDNEIVCTAPVRPSEIFFMRAVTTALYTSWMMVVFSLPVYSAYGTVFAADFNYWLLLAVTLLCTAATANCFGLLITIPLVNLFPARRTKDIILYLFLCFGIFIYIMFRLLRPEDMMQPDKFGHFVDYLASISRPAGPYLPSAWVAELLSGYLLDREVDWLLLLLISATPPALYILGEWAMGSWFHSGYAKAQESFGSSRSFRTRTGRLLPPWRWFVIKETKTFLRDSAEWAQLFMIGALVVVYLYNFKMLPVQQSPFAEEYITNIVSFLNIGLAGFIITSLAARFVYPAIGAEGSGFVVIQSGPISLACFLWYKYLFYCIPFTLLALFLVISSDQLLGIEGPMWWISVLLTMLITWTVIAIALGFGVLYADFRIENRAAALGGIGAILFLFTAMTFELLVIASGALPAYRLTATSLRGLEFKTGDLLFLLAWGAGSVLAAMLLSMFVLRKGLKKLEGQA